VPGHSPATALVSVRVGFLRAWTDCTTSWGRITTQLLQAALVSTSARFWSADSTASLTPLRPRPNEPWLSAPGRGLDNFLLDLVLDA